MTSLGSELPLRPILGERELAVAWLAERSILPAKTEWGRYTLAERDGEGQVGYGVKLLVVDNLGITSDDELARAREEVRRHPRWRE